ncbi:MAG: TonB-dependent receptor [Rhodospirillales bacterium]|nr:TonB-dependent receptor [Rhodospirillales bacterium]
MSHAISRGRGKTRAFLDGRRSRNLTALTIAALAVAVPADATPVEFNIPSEDLSKALIAFSDQSHLRIAVAPDVARGRTTPPVMGSFEPADALRLLLGADLTFEFIGDLDVVVEARKHAAAVTQPAHDDPPPGQAGLEEIVVTAQKRSEKIQATPLSITAFSAADLEKMGFTNFADLTNKVPSLAITPYAYAGSILEVFIRGVGQSDVVNISRDPGVGIYLDDVYLARSTALTTDLGDIERIEVLRGPQGTLYGRNTIGGAIKFVTAPPSGKFDAKQSIDVASFGYIHSLTTVDLPEYAGFSLKATFAKSEDDGWVRNSGTGGDYGSKDEEGYRIALRWHATDNLLVDYVFDYGTQHGTPNYIQRGYDDPAQDYPGIVDRAPLQPGRIETGWRPVDIPLKDDFKDYGHALTVTWDLSDQTSLKSITAFRENDSNFTLDTSEAFNSPQIEYYVLAERQASQEVILSGTDDDNALKYTVGALGFIESGSQVFGFINNPFIPHLPRFSDLTLVPGSARNSSAGVYGDVTWTPPILDGRLSIIVGGRYSSDSRYASGGFLATSGSVSYSSFDPSATIDYRWTDEIHSYAKYSQGYRAGGFNLYNVVLRPFQPENLTAYEIGLKSSWLDDRLRFNIDVFRQDYSDIQVNTVTLDPVLHSLVTVTENLGRATYQGLESDITFIPFEGLTLTANYSYLDASTHSSLTPLPFAPRWQYNLGAEYRFGVVGPGVLSALVGWSWIGTETAGGGSIPGYGLVNARATLAEIAAGSGHLSLSLWGKNLADRHYIYVNSGFGAISYGEPRSVGANLTYAF